VKRSKLLTVTVVALCGIAWVGSTMFHNLNGYCSAENRYLAKEAVFRKVVEQSILTVPAEDWLGHLNSSKSIASTIVPYDNFDDFALVNVACCSYYSYNMDMKIETVGRYDQLSDTQGVPLHYKLLGWAWRSVLVEHKLRFVDVRGKDKAKWFGHVFWVDTCGNRVLPPLKYIVG
jgi:hypothetical protein